MMKRLFATMLAGTLLAVPALPAAAQVGTLPTVPHLLVRGAADREVVPDRFAVTLSISYTDMDALAARTRVEDAIGTTIRAFRDSHAVKDSIDATTFTIAPDYAYEDNRQVFKGTKVSRRVSGVFATVDDTRLFLSKITSSESVQLSGIAASSSQEGTIRAALKREAMQQTRQTAALLAQAYGTTITGLYSVSDVAPSFAYGIEAGQWPRPANGAGGSYAGPPMPGPVPPPPAADVGAPPNSPESLSVGTITLAENLYAVFLIAD